ncbi:hypothetical protein BDA99DRAFT_531113 [Phascolomyces articulosus]|uniref:Aminoglycoside phosphotransferase domain-containing protein n=1 Tax=Phascolomyces articulosus TaxID=60185 RepID=A0AAD5KQV6_9FUNG|nr:hypothetical protein BDA99DRAFT_531113 [Phascolomyces articulosus]
MDELNETVLETYLVANIASFVGPLEIKQFNFRQSNPAYLIKDRNKQQYVLRKKLPPRALLSSTAHAVEREYLILKELSENTDVPVPKVYILCKDSSVLGTPFYVSLPYLVVEFLMPSIPCDERKLCYLSAIKTFAMLHRVDYRSIGLDNFGKTSNFYNSQIRLLGKISAVQAGAKDEETGTMIDPILRFDECFAWFKRNQPSDEAVIVHGDYKLAIITQDVAARVPRKQASSAQAKAYVLMFKSAAAHASDIVD